MKWKFIKSGTGDIKEVVILKLMTLAKGMNKKAYPVHDIFCPAGKIN